MTKKLNRFARFSIELVRSMIVLMMLLGLASHAAGSPMFIKAFAADSGDRPHTIPLLQDRQYCESDPVSMTPTGAFPTGYETHLVAQITTPNSDSSKRIKPITNRLCQISLGRTEIDFKSSVIKSPSIVSSALGRQFRLVGAKPSGTS